METRGLFKHTCGIYTLKIGRSIFRDYVLAGIPPDKNSSCKWIEAAAGGGGGGDTRYHAWP